MTEIAAFIACCIFAALALFQLALVFGAPWGRFAWGGRHTVLPAGLKVGSVVSIILYAIFVVFILNKAGTINTLPGGVVDVGMWVITAYFVLGIAMNAISPSKPERFVMTPVAFALAILFFLVSLV